MNDVINDNTKTVIELTQGKRVLVQGIIGRMAATKDWDYHKRKGIARIQRNIVTDGKRDKQSLIRFLLGLEVGDGIRASQISKEPIEYQGQLCINYLTDNLKTNRDKVERQKMEESAKIHSSIRAQMKQMKCCSIKLT